MDNMFVDFEKLPVVAILRGIQPEYASDVASILIDEGIRFIEVPVNSPEPFKSIENMVQTHGDRAIFGAGTITSEEEISKVEDAGGKLIVSPHCDPELISFSLSKNLIPVPGFYTPTEAFTALKAGAQYLKFFPAQMDIYKALTAVLPSHAKVIAVGGVDVDSMSQWKGVYGVGVGSAIFRPNYTMEEIRDRAQKFVKAVQETL